MADKNLVKDIINKIKYRIIFIKFNTEKTFHSNNILKRLLRDWSSEKNVSANRGKKI